MSDVDAAAGEPTADRQCGRCRRMFAGDPTLPVQTDWALCPACAEVLMPVHGRRTL